MLLVELKEHSSNHESFETSLADGRFDGSTYSIFEISRLASKFSCGGTKYWPLMILPNSSFSFFALKGNCPTIMTNKTTPSAQISAAYPLYSFFCTNSGDMYDDVPQLTYSRWSFWLYTLKPKSMILILPRSFKRMFSSFRSLWQIWQLCSTLTASAICLKFALHRGSGIPPFIDLLFKSWYRL